ncbi:MAG: sporulation membrane protein YtaF [Bacillota bacterium]
MNLGRGRDGPIGIFLLLLATSLDGLSAGLAYGLRGISFPWRSRLIVVGISVLALYFAVWGARSVGGLIRPAPARILGGMLLFALGLWTAGKNLLPRRLFPAGHIWTWRIRPLGLVIQIVREPLAADLDASGAIDGREALWLGLALSLDTLGTSFLVALGGKVPFFLPFLLGFANWLFLSAGLAGGRLFAHEEWPLLRVLPGLILMLLGLLRIF